MASTLSLENLILNKEIMFFSSGKKLDTNVENFGEFNWDLVKHIVKQSGNYLTVDGGISLQKYLADQNNLYMFTHFLVQFWYAGVGGGKRQHMAVHVDVDIDKLGLHYRKPKKEKLIYGLGQVGGDAANWVPEMPYFEKCWNFALDQTVGGAVGYPGYEHPRDDQSFRDRVAELAENYMIGTKEQIQRYRKYALESLKHLTNIADELKNDPEQIFDSYARLLGLGAVLRQTQLIADNLVFFSTLQR